VSDDIGSTPNKFFISQLHITATNGIPSTETEWLEIQVILVIGDILASARQLGNLIMLLTKYCSTASSRFSMVFSAFTLERYLICA
jgi:hypothetical protein